MTEKFVNFRTVFVLMSEMINLKNPAWARISCANLACWIKLNKSSN